MCKDQFRKQSGIILVEAIIGILIMGILGTGLSYSFVRLVKIQKDNNALVFVTNRIKQDVTTNVMATSCPASGSSSKTQKVAFGTQGFKQTINCTVQSFNVTVNGVSVAVTVPKIQYTYTSENNMLGGQYPFVVSN